MQKGRTPTFILLQALAILVICLVIVFVGGNIKEKFVDSQHAPFDRAEKCQIKGENNELFLFENNVCHPKCCPSELSCSNGCVCMTDEQKEMLKWRGMNRSSKTEMTY